MSEKDQTVDAPVEPTGESCEVEQSPHGRREGFTPPTEEEIRADAGIDAADGDEEP